MRISDIDTPALLVDLDRFERNLDRVAEYAAQHGLRLRPHTKTHKSVWVAGQQLKRGAAGLTVAKVSEAEVMLAAEPADVLIAFPVIGHLKLARLSEVARRTKLSVALDSAFGVQQLAEAARAAQVRVGVLAEVDVGMGRVGVDTGEQLLALARSILRQPHLSFEGIACYPGHIGDLEEPGQRAMAQFASVVESLLADFEAAGIEVGIVSGGSTPTLFHSHEIPGLNEIRPGTYVFNDLNTVFSGACTLDDCAASILATVVSTARPGQMILDGGSKTFSSDRASNAGETLYGRIVEAPGARLHKLNEEHGFVDMTRAEREFDVGDRVRVIPAHVCTAVNLQERIYGMRGDEVERVWNVDGRGKLQ